MADIQKTKVKPQIIAYGVVPVLRIVMLFLLVFAGWSTEAHAANLPVDVEPSGDAPLPSLTLYTPDKHEYALKDLQGPLTIVHFWATWCAPCVTELPALNAFADQYRAQGVSFVVVSLDNQLNADKVKEFYDEHQIKSFPIFFAKQSDVMKKMELIGIPTTLFVKNGHEIARANQDLHWENEAMGEYVKALVIGE